MKANYIINTLFKYSKLISKNQSIRSLIDFMKVRVGLIREVLFFSKKKDNDSIRKISRYNLEIVSEIPYEQLKIVKDLTAEKMLIIREMDIEQAKLALGISKEQLKIVKSLDLIQLRECVNYVNTKKLKPAIEPESIMSIDISQYRHSELSVANVLILADNNHPANVVQDYINAFLEHSQHNITIWNPLNTTEEDFSLFLNDYDVIIIHYSVCVLFEYFLPKYLMNKIIKYNGLKIQIIQDEFRWINRMANRLELLGIDILISSLNTENIKKVYHHYGLRYVKKYHSLPGYVPNYLLTRNSPPIENRNNHLTYRGRQLHYYYGAVSQEKSTIETYFKEISRKYNLKVNLASKEDERLYGEDWINLIQSSKAVLGVEGGASIFDFDETISLNVNKYLMYYPGVDFSIVAKEVLKPYEGNIIHRTITPRIFEAICLRTALVLYPGSYSNILIPWQHYIPIEKDGANVSVVVERLKDDSYLAEMTDRAYREIALNPELQFKNYISKLDILISNELRAK
ncbi:hypothetical protein [Legionella nagasakiensis]|uniref:hypothetical protein n=1 Tax=Legionella nagasakiensis TaxID=535290 RepID=UPI0010546DAE|nr:hypothetical protein [Legionella nagasakiensis]